MEQTLTFPCSQQEGPPCDRSLATCKPSESNGEYNFGCACICCTERRLGFTLTPPARNVIWTFCLSDISWKIAIAIQPWMYKRRKFRGIIDSVRFNHTVKNSRWNDNCDSFVDYESRVLLLGTIAFYILLLLIDLNFDHRRLLSTVLIFSCVEI